MKKGVRVCRGVWPGFDIKGYGILLEISLALTKFHSSHSCTAKRGFISPAILSMTFTETDAVILNTCQLPIKY